MRTIFKNHEPENELHHSQFHWGRQALKNGAHDTEKLPLKTSSKKIWHSEVNLII
jgi:hypothetical protein